MWLPWPHCGFPIYWMKWYLGVMSQIKIYNAETWKYRPILATSNNEVSETRNNFYLPSMIKSQHINTCPLKKKKRAFKTIVFIFFSLFFLFFFNSRHHKCTRNLQAKGPNTEAYVLPNLHRWHEAVRHLALKRCSSAHLAQYQPFTLAITALLTGSVSPTCPPLCTPARSLHPRTARTSAFRTCNPTLTCIRESRREAVLCLLPAHPCIPCLFPCCSHFLDAQPREAAGWGANSTPLLNCIQPHLRIPPNLQAHLRCYLF